MLHVSRKTNAIAVHLELTTVLTLVCANWFYLPLRHSLHHTYTTNFNIQATSLSSLGVSNIDAHCRLACKSGICLIVAVCIHCYTFQCICWSFHTLAYCCTSIAQAIKTSLLIKHHMLVCQICFLPMSLTDVKSSFSIGVRSSAFG